MKRRKAKRPRSRKPDARQVEGRLTIARIRVLPEWLWPSRLPNIAAEVIVDQDVRAIVERLR